MMANYLPQIWQRRPDSNVYLTFDDGPDPEITPRLLDTLRKAHARATFFLIGEKAERHPDIVLQIKQEGHAIGNHSFTHPRLVFKSKEQIRQEVARTDRILKQITGGEVVLFRPPYGQFGWNCLRVLRATRHRIVLWSLSVRDYEKRATPDMIQKRLQQIHSGGQIVLLHDGHPNGALMLRALQNYFEKIKSDELNFQALPDFRTVKLRDDLISSNDAEIK